LELADPVRVVIIDECPIFRIGLERVLSGDPKFEVVGHCTSAPEALAQLELSDPAVVFLDVLDEGIKVATEIRRRAPRVRILFLTNSEQHEHVTGALHAGAAAYMLKGISPDSLMQTLNIVLAGETYIMPRLATKLLVAESQRPVDTQSNAERIRSLTARERQILMELSDGQTNKDIAKKLAIAEKTVKHYMGQILQKLAVRNRTQAVIMSQGWQEAGQGRGRKTS
jgi:two-component system, NarL family, nitrate/nitrite response regulator NarL